jgi:pimeloyl-ACP methyl ester carboxylesterase
MPLASTSHGALYYEVIDRVAPWEQKRDPILFHHGIGASAGIWTEWIGALADHHPIVTFDMRGYGRSMIPPPDFRWSLDLFIADVFAVADAAGAQRFHLVGGTIGLAATSARAERIATQTVSMADISAPRSSASMSGGASSRKGASRSGPTSSCATASTTARSRPSAGPGSPRSRKPGHRMRSSARWPCWSEPTWRRFCREFGARCYCSTPMAARSSRSRSRRRWTGFCPMRGSMSLVLPGMGCPFPMGSNAPRFCALSSTGRIGDNPAATEGPR